MKVITPIGLSGIKDYFQCLDDYIRKGQIGNVLFKLGLNSNNTFLLLYFYYNHVPNKYIHDMKDYFECGFPHPLLGTLTLSIFL